MYASAGLQSRMPCRQWREWHGGGAALLLQARWLGRRREFDQVRNRETVFLLSISLKLVPNFHVIYQDKLRITQAVEILKGRFR